MPTTIQLPTSSPTRLPLYLLAAWFILNLLQAGLTPLDPDETYYWMYAGSLDWGYYDHPPAVALIVSLGKDWLPGALGLRFGHVLVSTVTIAGMWHLLDKPKGEMLWLAAGLVFAQPFLNVYGFIATPDGPLLMFTVFYLLAYRRFLEGPSIVNGAIWGITMAGLLYSKYHGVMLIFFSVLPYLFWLIRQPGAWVAALGGAALYFPHLYWQYANDFPSFRYHLNGRNDAYQFKYTTQYILNQLAIFSPLLVWFYVKTFLNFKKTTAKEDRFPRAMFWLTIGFLVFFLYTTTKGGTEAQWTALLSIPLCYLTFRAARDHFPKWRNGIWTLSLITIGILILARLLLMAPREWVPFDKPFDHAPWVEELSKKAGDLPVMVQNSYRYSSLYEFYSGKPAWTFTDVQYRRNQYDLWTEDSIFHNQPVFLLGQSSWENPEAEPFRTQKRNMRVQKVDSFQVMKGLTLTTMDQFPDTLRRGERYPLSLVAETSLPLRMDAGSLPLAPFAAVHYEQEELLFWRLIDGNGALSKTTLTPNTPGMLWAGTFQVYANSPLGPAEIEFGLAYKGMPPIRNQSARYSVIIIE
jgi:hypothetical protein